MNQDKKLNQILNSNKTYIILLFFVLFYLFQDDKILNKPYWLFWTNSIVSFILISAFCIWRFMKFKQYYVEKFRSKFFVFLFLIGIVILTILSQAIISIPINFLIKSTAKDSNIEYFECKITNVVKTGIDKIHFTFLNRKYYRYFNVTNYDRKDLLNNYYLQIGVKKGCLDTYLIESMDFIEK